MSPFFAILHYLGWLRADSLEEIVGLDISYHGGLSVDGGATDNESSHSEDMARYYQRREEQRRSHRNKMRRRILMMDMSLSGHKPRSDDDHLNHLEDPPLSCSGHSQRNVEDHMNHLDDDPPLSASLPAMAVAREHTK